MPEIPGILCAQTSTYIHTNDTIMTFLKIVFWSLSLVHIKLHHSFKGCIVFVLVTHCVTNPVAENNTFINSQFL